MNLANWLLRAAKAYPNATAVTFGDRAVSDYGRFADRAARLASALKTLGIGAGDPVGIIAKNSPGYLDVLFGIWWAGASAVPVNAKLHGAEIAWILENCGAKTAFASADIEAALSEHKPASLSNLFTIDSAEYGQLYVNEQCPISDRAPDDLAWLFYTSGTTGRPKGAMLTHRNLAAMSFAYLCDVNPAEPGLSLLHAAPMSHGSGLYIMAHILRFGINAVPESGGFNPPEILKFFELRPQTSMFAAPTMIKRLVECDNDIDPSVIRTIIWGGAPMHFADIVTALDRFGAVFVQIYGQGETPMTTTVLSKQDIANRNHPRWNERMGSAGLVNSAVEVRVADRNDNTLRPGETGEILVRGDTVMRGYWNNPEATKQTLKGGWLHTGDLGSFDEEGYLTLKDRSKDVIISGGTNIYPREVEEVLLKSANVAEVSVIGRPDPEWGEVVVAYVAGDATIKELDALCRQHIARFKRPKDYVYLEALPKNNYGKILKTELREQDARRCASEMPGNRLGQDD